jgi:oxygen-independent coproporphyrinogen-3 oxidase
MEFWLARLLGFITREENGYRLTPLGAYYFHYFENFYTLAYIDKMWGIMRHEAFPEGIEL